MDNSRCSYKFQWDIFKNLVVIFSAAIVGLFICGGIIFQRNNYARTIYEENTCEVIASNYYESRCTASRGGSYVCFIPTWSVIYSIFDDVKEIRVNATIEYSGFRRISAAEDKLNQYEVSGTSNINA